MTGSTTICVTRWTAIWTRRSTTSPGSSPSHDSESQVHEVRLFNQYDNGAVWNAGVFYFEEDQRTFLGATGDRGPFFSGLEFNQRTQTESIAFYADATYPVTDTFRVTAGIRYSDEDKERQGVNARYGFASAAQATAAAAVCGSGRKASSSTSSTARSSIRTPMATVR
jgi:outer membrane receptor protein involved in Fe transport